jgi:hypothetical protein
LKIGEETKGLKVYAGNFEVSEHQKTAGTLEIAKNIFRIFTKDYFNNRVITPSGILQDKHLQLIVTSGFNIIDQINKVPEYKERLRILNGSIVIEEATYLKYERDHYMQIFIYGILMILLFLHVNIYMENRGKNNTNTGKTR